jgi:hypothetical protein
MLARLPTTDAVLVGPGGTNEERERVGEERREKVRER